MDERRDNVPFDPRYFEKRGSPPSLRETFTHIYETDLWSGRQSVSGAGSGRDQTEVIETELPRLLAELGTETLLDLPCGDFGWMQHITLPIQQYIGADIVEELIQRNRDHYEDARHRFLVLDLTSDTLPQADLLFCRDALVHLSFDDINAALRNLRDSDIPLLLTTTFPDCVQNEDIKTGDWRLLNLERPPFHFPPPLRFINEGCTEGAGSYRDKSLGLWRVDDLNI